MGFVVPLALCGVLIHGLPYSAIGLVLRFVPHTGEEVATNKMAGGLMFYPLPRPVRLLDTRANQGNCDSVSTPIAAGTSLTTLARTSGTSSVDASRASVPDDSTTIASMSPLKRPCRRRGRFWPATRPISISK